MSDPQNASKPTIGSVAGTDGNEGLTSVVARQRLESSGPNAIIEEEQHPARQALAKLWAPIPWMLEAAILLQICVGEFVEAGFVAFLVVFNAGLGLLQERRAQATLDALKSRLALVASAKRDGHWLMIPAATLVEGDVVKLSLGAVVAADVRLTGGSVLLDQSMLTGESLPVEAGTGAETFAGALVRRGEAVGVVIATGQRTKFGRTAELVQNAKVESSQQKTVMRVVRNLAIFNGFVTLGLIAYTQVLHMPRAQVIPMTLVAVLASIPVALPSMFTLAAAVGARALARQGILPTSLGAVDEAGGIDILCADKTGTLTRNSLVVTTVCPMPGQQSARVLAFAALASSDGGQDPVDVAIHAAAAAASLADAPALASFLAFDPATKRAEATARQSDGSLIRVVKGALAEVQAISRHSPDAFGLAEGLQAKGYRLLAVAAGADSSLSIVGLIALSDPPREDSAALVAELAGLGVRTVMVTGDAAKTAGVVAAAIGISGAVFTGTSIPDNFQTDGFAVFAGILPEDKYRLVKAFQQNGHNVGMCGDGANDAPALRQAQMGIAVSTATDVAKSSAGMVLTEPGLGGIVAAVKEGRATFQRVFTYTLRSIVHKVVQVLFLAAGLVITGQAILTPLLMILMMVTGDFLAMSSSTDNVRPSNVPSVWRIDHLTIAGVVMGLVDLAFCVTCLALGKFTFLLNPETLRTLAVVTLVFSGQAVFYVSRERRHLWSSMPGKWLLASSIVDLGFISLLSTRGILMAPIPLSLLCTMIAAAALFALVLDETKLLVFRRLRIV